jgi:hypothetical protein
VTGFELPATDVVVVPDVVGMLFHVGRDTARAAGVTLANPDPDGPPIGALAWPGPFFVQSQDLPPGTVARRWDSLPVWLTTDSSFVAAHLENPTPPLILTDQAIPPVPRTFPEPGIDISGSAIR